MHICNIESLCETNKKRTWRNIIWLKFVRIANYFAIEIGFFGKMKFDHIFFCLSLISMVFCRLLFIQNCKKKLNKWINRWLKNSPQGYYSPNTIPVSSTAQRIHHRPSPSNCSYSNPIAVIYPNLWTHHALMQSINYHSIVIYWDWWYLKRHHSAVLKYCCGSALIPPISVNWWMPID